ncbi:hypothetical protein OBBRIDRAFT_70653 [Obba rivulosa]|uniref:Uncharacterized protein n=1 Tax=Obba rivulosa TaxID=1052685 RepID=A0A8E2AXW4_9APHY|nr:hypothetical protein OBBRIDRAFT_70653 [Obba rivulosa]
MCGALFSLGSTSTSGSPASPGHLNEPCGSSMYDCCIRMRGKLLCCPVGGCSSCRKWLLPFYESFGDSWSLTAVLVR